MVLVGAGAELVVAAAEVAAAAELVPAAPDVAAAALVTAAALVAPAAAAEVEEPVAAAPLELLPPQAVTRTAVAATPSVALSRRDGALMVVPFTNVGCCVPLQRAA
ncbi:hypothetical protein acdb102_12430 [Acidothermaceae bacterium B102]|nr:hypothetical protein acdb102_12430 [Acidothermaceae bacterium B102]